MTMDTISNIMESKCSNDWVHQLNSTLKDTERYSLDIIKNAMQPRDVYDVAYKINQKSHRLLTVINLYFV